jgi:diguanylate cyclase (GGDEF)-like protein
MMFEGAVVAATDYIVYQRVPDPRPPNPSHAIDSAAVEAVRKFLSNESIVSLRITQRGRLRLYRLRDEILQRDRIRDDFGVLWALRHFRPDLEVRLRLREPSRPFSVVLLDVDKLKDLNRELGNPGADRVLTGIFEALRDIVRPHDAYRLGGDEAGAILPGISLADAEKLAEEIRRAVETRPWPNLPIQTRPTVSVGVGTFTSATWIEPEALYEVVDRIRGRAKEVRNKVVAEAVAAIS